jgi:TPR repeat protein
MNQRDPEFQFIQGEFAYRFCADFTTAKTRLTFAAKRGHTRAQYLLASIFEEEKAFKSAAKWYRLAAWQGRLPEAAFRLGCLYLSGFGVRQDTREAIKWLRQAAFGADTNAMCALGTLTDKPEAYAWYRLAALRKSSEAAKALREMVGSMTHEQIKEGTRLVAELRNQIKRPTARKQRVQKSAKVYVGSQEIMGAMCEWRVDLWVQHVGIDWVVTFKGDEGNAEKVGPLEAKALVEEMDDRGLDTEEFRAHLRASKVPMLTKLAQEIVEPQS